MNKQQAKSKEQKITSLRPPLDKGGKEGGYLSKWDKGALLHVLCSMLIIVFAWSGLAYAQKDDPAKKVPALCYECHAKLKESLSRSYVHSPFKKGECISCHNPHTSNIKGLVKEDINSLCLKCHNEIKKSLKKEFVHYALKKGMCTDCHYTHSGEHKYLLVKSQKDLCWNCHEPLKEQLKKSHVHRPFTAGECSSCHEPHASSEENQILDAPNKLCKKCHLPRCKVKNVSITYATEKLDCTACHGGHASNFSGILGPYGHSAFLDKNCEQCHNPIIQNKKITTKTAGRDLCLNCHKKDKTKFREGDVHGTAEKGGCGMCHSYHASKRKSLTAKETAVCIKCHEGTEKKALLMEKALKSIRCIPVKDRKCFECHIPLHSDNPLYFKADEIKTCAICHTTQHKISHPLGQDVKDPRNDKPITCNTCHSMHSAKAEFMLHFDRKRQLCIQCHKK
ncbi:MAG: cytochrome c3 family protein [Nitrospirota bacterium]